MGLFRCAMNRRRFQPVQNGRPRRFCNRLLRLRLSLAVQIQLHIQLNQPRSFRGQLLLLREWLTDLSLCRCLLVIEVFKLLLNAAQTLRHFIQRVLDADKVASGIRTEFNAMGHLAFQRQRVRFPHGIKSNGHGKAAIAADLYRVFALDLLAGIQQRGTGVFLIGEPVAANLHADKALCRERMRREGLHIRLQPTNKALVFFYLFRKVFQQTILQAELLAVVVCLVGQKRTDAAKLQDALAAIQHGKDGISIRGIYERSDAKVREQEGMPRVKGFLSDPFDTKVEIVENGVRYFVDVAEGQKTGFFLDQKYNRKAIWPLCPGAEVLDCFTHTGSFALNAGLAGASHVLGVDASELGVAQARENAALNGLSDRVEFLCADVFALLPELEAKGQKFDLVILDPPAFTKSRASVKKAVTGYREINLRAMKLIRDGGFLATCSCSHFVDYELFTQTIGQAARNVHKRLRQVEYRTQAPDHPILWDAEDSYYLKFYIFQVCNEK